MGARENAGMKSEYFKINADGMLYKSLKEPKEGYEKHVSESGAVSYWKTYYNGIEGYLYRISEREADIAGKKVKFLSIDILDEDNVHSLINIPLLTTKGGLNSYVKSIVSYFENIDLGRKIVINPAKKRPGEEFSPMKFFISYCRETPDGKDELIPQFFKKGQNGWPDKTRVVGFGGKETFSFQDQDNFAYGKLQEYMKVLNENRPNLSNNTQTSPVEEDRPGGNSPAGGHVGYGTGSYNAPTPPTPPIQAQAPSYQNNSFGGNGAEVDDLPF